MKKGILYAIGAYLMWGLFPLYWKQLETIPALQLIGHRIAWSFILLIVVVFVTRQWKDFRSALNSKTIRIYLIAALLISVNWFTYVWAVNNGFVVETSLGYYIIRFSVFCWVLLFFVSGFVPSSGFRLCWPRQVCFIWPLPTAHFPGLHSRWPSHSGFMALSKRPRR